MQERGQTLFLFKHLLEMKNIRKLHSILLIVIFLVMLAAGCYYKVPEKIKVDWFPDHSEIPNDNLKP